MKPFLIGICLTILGLGTKAQLQQPVTWSYAAKKVNAREAVLYLKATIEQGWHLYSQHLKPGGPHPTSFSFVPAKGNYSLLGKVQEPKAISKGEKVFKMTVAYFENSVIFQQKIKLLGKKPFVVKGKLEYMVCNDAQCLPPTEVEFHIPVK